MWMQKGKEADLYLFFVVPLEPSAVPDEWRQYWQTSTFQETMKML